jgi:hypothetical protein
MLIAFELEGDLREILKSREAVISISLQKGFINDDKYFIGANVYIRNSWIMDREKKNASLLLTVSKHEKEQENVSSHAGQSIITTGNKHSSSKTNRGKHKLSKNKA